MATIAMPPMPPTIPTAVIPPLTMAWRGSMAGKMRNDKEEETRITAFIAQLKVYLTLKYGRNWSNKEALQLATEA